MMDFDNILIQVGEWGRYQKFITCLLCFPITFALPYTFMGQLFQASAAADHWCYVPELVQLPVEIGKKLSLPLETVDGIVAFSKCYMFERNYSQVLENLDLFNDSAIRLNASDAQIKCRQGWTYDSIEYRPTIATEYDWVCDDDWKGVVSLTVFFIGSCVGCLGLGYISDKYGRVPTVIIANLIGCVASLATAAAQGFASFTVIRFFAGIAYDMSSMSFYILVLEYIGPTYRTNLSNISFGVFFTFGSVVLPWLSYALPTWRYFSLVTAIPFALILPFFKVLPESARWLISRNRVDDAIGVLRNIAKINRTELKEEFWDSTKRELELAAAEEVNPKEKCTILDLFKTPRLRRRTILVCTIWFIIMLVYDGLVRNTENLGWNIYLSSTLGNMTELPAALLTLAVLDRLGRRFFAVVIFCLSAIFCLSVAGVPPGNADWYVGLAVSARFFVTILMNIYLQYIAELFPTVVRGQGMSLAHVIGFLGSMVSPLMVYLGKYKKELPILIFGGITVIGTICALFLPETLYETLPESLDDGEKFGEGQPFLYYPRPNHSHKAQKLDMNLQVIHVAHLSSNGVTESDISSNNSNGQETMHL